jgi:predicted transcriptional regulator
LKSTLRDARELVGLSQVGLDDKAGLPRGTTFDLETGRNRRPAYDTVVCIVRALQRAGLKGASAERIFPVSDRSEAASR